MQKSLTRRVLVIVFVFGPNIHFGQIISNMSFEGTPRPDVPPPGWSPCNTFSTPDTQPGFWRLTKAASHGNTYVSLVTRGNLGPYANHCEAVQTQLLEPLAKEKSYRLRLDLAFSKDWGHTIGFDETVLLYDTPAKLRVFGGATSCTKSDLFWESPAIDHTDWRAYTFDLAPVIDNVTYLIFEVAYAKDSTYFGNVLIDNLWIDPCSFATPIQTQGFDSLICERDVIVLDATTPGGVYLWSTGSVQSSITVAFPGTFAVEVFNGCVTETFDFNINEQGCNCDTAPPIQTMSFDLVICEWDSVLLDASTPDGTYQWNNGSNAPSVTVSSSGKFTVEVSNGCVKQTFAYLVEERECACTVVVPNVFTPNGDDVNEAFEIEGSLDIARFDLRIFNRWGQQLYHTNDLTETWRGEPPGDASSGVYFWTIEVTCIRRDSIVANAFKGWVSVVK